MALERAIEAPVLLLGGGAAGAAQEDASGWVVLRDRVVVFGTRLGEDGEPEAALVPWPGARTYLPLASGATVRATYLPDAVLEREDAGILHGTWIETCATSPLLVDGRPVRVADVPTTGCTLPALSRAALLVWLARRLAPDVDAASFRALLHSDGELRGAVAGTLERGLSGRRRIRRSRAVRGAGHSPAAHPVR